MWCLSSSEALMFFIYKQQQINIILIACLAFLHSFVYKTTMQRNLHLATVRALDSSLLFRR
jgi:hypothetical protein